jgi:hypothetical protein
MIPSLTGAPAGNLDLKPDSARAAGIRVGKRDSCLVSGGRGGDHAALSLRLRRRQAGSRAPRLSAVTELRSESSCRPNDYMIMMVTRPRPFNLKNRLGQSRHCQAVSEPDSDSMRRCRPGPTRKAPPLPTGLTPGPPAAPRAGPHAGRAPPDGGLGGGAVGGDTVQSAGRRRRREARARDN